MATAKFLKAMTAIMAELNKENTVLVPSETKGWLIPIRADKIKEFFGEDTPKAPEDFAEAYYKLPVAGRAVLALRYGLFSGVSFTIGDVHRLIGIERQEVSAIESRSRHRIYAELGIAAPQEPARPVPVHVKIRRKLRREARDGDC